MAGLATVRVLLVEDDSDDRSLVVDLLGDAKRAYFIVEDADTGKKAQEKIKKNRYDVILMDYRLPDITGLQMMEWMADNHFRLPVVLVTSHGDRRLQVEALEAGFAEYLEKGTFDADKLERTLMYAIGLHDRQTRSGGDGGVGLLIQELVGLTRESVSAQTKTANQMAELRSDLKDDVADLKLHGEAQVAMILKQVTKGPWEKIKDMLNWAVLHPVAALVIVALLAGMVVLIVLLINLVDAEKVKLLRGAKAVAGLLPWVPWGSG